jgi:hypothetical protein
LTLITRHDWGQHNLPGSRGVTVHSHLFMVTMAVGSIIEFAPRLAAELA